MESKNNLDFVRFVNSVITKVKDKQQEGNNTDTGFRAVMRRADNPAFESAAWEYLIPFCNIQNDFERIPFALIGAAIAKVRPQCNGSAGLGKAFRIVCQKADDYEAAFKRESRRFRRLLACDSSSELCLILRPILHYLASKDADLDYCQILRDLVYWSQDPKKFQKIKQRWAVDFYEKLKSNDEEADA